MSDTTPAHRGLPTARRELHVVQVANGWIIQPAALAAAMDAEGQPYPPNRPSDITIAKTPMELAGYIEAWAKEQARASLSSPRIGPSYQD